MSIRLGENLVATAGMLFPIGGMYFATNDISPAAMIGGSWAKIADKIPFQNDRIGGRSAKVWRSLAFAGLTLNNNTASVPFTGLTAWSEGATYDSTNRRFYITESGVWQITYSGGVSGLSAGTFKFLLYKNGVAQRTSGHTVASGNENTWNRPNDTVVIELDAGDYLHVTAGITDTTNRPNAGGLLETFISGELIGYKENKPTEYIVSVWRRVA